ncbi:hypothetical protein ACLOJK_006450 [Asimina triloba]
MAPKKVTHAVPNPETGGEQSVFPQPKEGSSLPPQDSPDNAAANTPDLPLYDSDRNDRALRVHVDLPVEVAELTLRQTQYDFDCNDRTLRVHVDLLEEIREKDRMKNFRY